MITAICPGSFDPVTLGHIDVISRAAAVFGRVVVAVMNNSQKQYLFPPETRKKMLDDCLNAYDNVDVIFYDGLLAELAADCSPSVFVKGLRNTVDFEYEMQMSVINRGLTVKPDTFFIPCDSRYLHVSSGVVRELALYGGDLTGYVTDNVYEELKELFPALQKD